MRHIERHRTAHIGWLRAAVLGANDGLISTASLVVGVAASGVPRSAVLIAGVAGLVASAMSMAAGEYVSVSSPADTEGADLARERRELASDDVAERAELAAIYVDRGLTPLLAAQVAEQLMAKDALAAHARDELGHSDATAARPLQAARVGGNLRRGCAAAGRSLGRGAAGAAGAPRHRERANPPGCVGRGGRARRGRGHVAGRTQGDLLGRTRHGRIGFGRAVVWGDGLEVVRCPSSQNGMQKHQ
jgi:VIT1/CCC1 family predicted Fe2+/Mn2+ transporter